MNKKVFFGGALGVASMALAGTASLVSAAKPETHTRDEIPAKYRWDFAAIYPDWTAWEAGMKEMEAKMDAFVTMKGTLASGPAALLKAYTAFDEIGVLQYKIYRYPQLQRDVDTRNQEVAARFQRVGAVLAKFGTATDRKSVV